MRSTSLPCQECTPTYDRLSALYGETHFRQNDESPDPGGIEALET